jgi:LysM repeat protein
MPDRRSARFLAPLALVAFAIVLVLLISSAGGGGNSKPSQTQEKRTPVTRKPQGPPRRYTVKSSDSSLDQIARENGVATARLLQLNPDLDPQALVPGQRIKLRP